MISYEWETETFSSGGVDHNFVTYDGSGETMKHIALYIREPKSYYQVDGGWGHRSLFTLFRHCHSVTDVSYFPTLEAAKLAAELMLAS